MITESVRKNSTLQEYSSNNNSVKLRKVRFQDINDPTSEAKGVKRQKFGAFFKSVFHKHKKKKKLEHDNCEYQFDEATEITIKNKANITVDIEAEENFEEKKDVIDNNEDKNNEDDNDINDNKNNEHDIDINDDKDNKDNNDKKNNGNNNGKEVHDTEDKNHDDLIMDKTEDVSDTSKERNMVEEIEEQNQDDCNIKGNYSENSYIHTILTSVQQCINFDKFWQFCLKDPNEETEKDKAVMQNVVDYIMDDNGNEIENVSNEKATLKENTEDNNMEEKGPDIMNNDIHLKYTNIEEDENFSFETFSFTNTRESVYVTPISDPEDNAQISLQIGDNNSLAEVSPLRKSEKRSDLRGKEEVRKLKMFGL